MSYYFDCPVGLNGAQGDNLTFEHERIQNRTYNNSNNDDNTHWYKLAILTTALSIYMHSPFIKSQRMQRNKQCWRW